MKIIQLNAWHNKLFSSIIELIKEEDPDILCLQEFMNADEPVLFDDLFIHGLSLLHEHTDLRHAFYSPHFTTQLSGKTISQGNGIFCKAAFSSTKVELTHGEYFSDYKVTEGNRQKVNDIQIVQIDVNGRNLTVANHHGYWMPDPYGNEDSVRSMQRAKEFLEKEAGPYIFCGDFNVSPDSPPMQIFDGFLNNLTQSHQLETTLSSLHRVQDKAVACDYILVSNDIEVVSFRASEKLVSDHKALVLEFDL